jgi:hypothetical protein
MNLIMKLAASKNDEKIEIKGHDTSFLDFAFRNLLLKNWNTIINTEKTIKTATLIGTISTFIHDKSFVYTMHYYEVKASHYDENTKAFVYEVAPGEEKERKIMDDITRKITFFMEDKKNDR